VWSALRQVGAQPVPIPVDEEGLDVWALARLIERGRVRAVHVTPHRQFPTTAGMAPVRRQALLDLAARHRLLIIEEDYDYDLHYDGRPMPPLIADDRHGSVVCVSTLSQVLGRGLHAGFVVAPEAVIERLASHRDLCPELDGEPVVDCAIAELFEDGAVA